MDDIAKKGGKWDEAKHPRAKDGKFGSGQGSSNPKPGGTSQQAFLAGIKSTGVGPKSLDAMDALAAGKRKEDLTPQQKATLDKLAKAGLVEAFEDGSYKISDQGNAFLQAAKKGDAKGARAAIDGARTGKPAAKPADSKPAAKPPAKPAGRKPAASTPAARKPAAAKPAGGKGAPKGSGAAKPAAKPAGSAAAPKGGTAAKPPESSKPTPPAKPGAATAGKQPVQGKQPAGASQRKVLAAVRDTGVGPKSLDALTAVANQKPGQKPTAQQKATLDRLAATGMVERFEDGSHALTERGKQFLEATSRGDAAAARAAITGSSTTTKALGGPSWHSFFAIRKVDEEQRLVEGIASTESIDSQPGMFKGQAYEGDVVDRTAIEAALDDYLKWANLREMHQPSAAGTVVKAEVIDGQLHITARVVDESAWQKVKAGVYKGFSIGGKVLDAALAKVGGRTVRRIVKLALHEISLVDRPANPDARITVWKAEGVSPEGHEEPMEELLKAAAGDPMKIVTLIQAARNEAELGGDMDGAQLYTQAIALVLQAGGDAEAPEPEGDDGAGDESLDPEGEGDEPIQLSQEPGDLAKVGRALSGKNAKQVHQTIKSLAAMLADSGDTTAAQLLAAYQPAKEEAPPVDAEKMAGTVGEALQKSLSPLFDGLTKTIDGLATRVEQLERQPAPGGPVLRPAEKQLPGQVKKGETPAEQPTGPALGELRKMAATEPDPIRRAEYTRQLIIAEASLASR